jgi:hypothetical protein
MEEMMTRGRAAVVIGLALAAAACGHPEQRVVDQYFNALRAGDNDTLTSFAAVKFDQKVDDWKIVAVGPESTSPAGLADLAKKVKDLEAELAANSKSAQAYRLDHYREIDAVREAQDGKKPIPPNVKGVADAWGQFNDKDRELKVGVADAKRAVEREKRLVGLSEGTIEGVEAMTGQMSSKDVELSLTIGGTAKPYLMTLRKYELQGGDQAGPRMMNRWFIYSLVPKG